MTWTWVVAMEVVTSGYILKVKWKGFADWLDVEYERKEFGLNHWMGSLQEEQSARGVGAEISGARF